MAATFVVEDGSIVSGANAYVTLADANQYHENFGNPSAWSGATDANKQAAIRQATQFIDQEYGPQFKGTRANSEQELMFPRSGVTARDGFWYPHDEIPQRLKDATAILALKAISETLMADQTNPGTIKKETVKVGPITESKEYMGGKDQEKYYRLAENLLLDLLTDGAEMIRG